jgi:hypothetical protein
LAPSLGFPGFVDFRRLEGYPFAQGDAEISLISGFFAALGAQ